MAQLEPGENFVATHSTLEEGEGGKLRGETGEKLEKTSGRAARAGKGTKPEGAMPRVVPESYEEETRRSKRHVQARARYHALPATERVKRSRLKSSCLNVAPQP